MAKKETRIYPINTGWCKADLGTYLYMKGEGGKQVDIPVVCFYVDTGDHKLMIDTGLPDAERATRYHHDCSKRDCLDSPDALAQTAANLRRAVADFFARQPAVTGWQTPPPQI